MSSGMRWTFIWWTRFNLAGWLALFAVRNKLGWYDVIVTLIAMGCCYSLPGLERKARFTQMVEEERSKERDK